MLDASLLADNLYFIVEREQACAGMSVREITDAMAEAYEAYFGNEITLDADVTNAGEQFIKDLYANGLVLVDDTDAVNDNANV